MKTSHLMAAGASRFAHFAGLTRASRRADEDDQHDDEASDGDEDEPKGKRSKARRAEEDDDGKDAEDGDDEPKGKRSKASDEDDEQPKGKRSKARRAADDDDDGKDASDDDDDDDDDDDKREMTGSSSAANARRRERARCAAIFGHKAAADNVALAANLAFDTTMTRAEAIAVLRGQQGRAPAPRGRTSNRQERNADLSSGGEGGSGRKAGSSWDRSFKSVGVIPRG